MENTTHPNVITKWVKISLLGVGQCALSGNLISGGLILAAIGYAHWQAALWFWLGSLLSSLFAKALKAPDELIDIGMYGFGGGYVGVLVGVFFMLHVPAAQGELIMLLIMGSILVVPVTTALTAGFAKAGISATALPVVLVVYMFLAGFLFVSDTHHLTPEIGALLSPAAGDLTAPYTWKTFAFGTLGAYGQMFLFANPVTGGLVLAAIFVQSRIMGLMGILGCLISLGISMWVGIPAVKVAEGAYAFNSMLTMMALGGVFIYLDWRSFIYAVIGNVLAMWVFMAASTILAVFHLPAMVIGFAIVTALMTYSAKFFGAVRLIDMDKISIPEKSLLKDAPPLPATAS